MTESSVGIPALDKRAFFEDMGYTPHAGQREVHGSAANRRIVACGVRWGKTLCAAMEGLACAMEPRKRSVGWVVAPTYDLADRVFREVVMLAAEHLRHRIVSLRESDRRLLIRNMGGGVTEIRGKSADNPVSLLGEGLDWVIVDEAARMKPEIWESHLSQRLIDKKGWAMLISTPKGKGYFHELYRRGQGKDENYESWNFPSWTNPTLDAEVIEAERERLPDRVFRQEYGAEFGDGAGLVFRNVRACATGSWHGPVTGAPYYAGLDLARVEDYTVLVIMDELGRVVGAQRFRRLDWDAQIKKIVGAVKMFGGMKILVDATGVGDPICEALSRKGCRAKPFVLTNRSKAAIIDNLALRLEQNKIVLPKLNLWPDLIDELESFEYRTSESGTVRSGAPHGMHDDCVIALALAAWNFHQHQNRVRVRVIKRVPPGGFRARNRMGRL